MELETVIGERRLHAEAPVDALRERLDRLRGQLSELRFAVDPGPAPTHPVLGVLATLFLLGTLGMLALLLLAALGGAEPTIPLCWLPVVGFAWWLRRRVVINPMQLPQGADRAAERARFQRREESELLLLGRLETAAQVLALLAPDLSHTASCTLDVELERGPRGLQQHTAVWTGNGWHTLKHAEWLKLRGVLADGSRFLLAIADHEEKLERGRMKPRGRKITRTVVSEGLQVQLAIKPKKGRYPALATVLSQPPLALLRGMEGPPPRLKGELLRVSVLVPRGTVVKTPDAVAAAFFSLYDRLGAAQAQGVSP